MGLPGAFKKQQEEKEKEAIQNTQEDEKDYEILEEDSDFGEPTEEEILEYAKFIKMDLDNHSDLLWIAKEGLKAKVPNPWIICKTKGTDDIYYFNPQTGQSQWEHPLDHEFIALYNKEKQKKQNLHDIEDIEQQKAAEADSAIQNKGQSTKPEEESEVLEEVHLDDPTEDEINEYAKFLELDVDQDKDLLWIAKEGLKAPLPSPWKMCRVKATEEIYYFNFDTGESQWDHPVDKYYKELVQTEKNKKSIFTNTPIAVTEAAATAKTVTS